MAGSDIPIILFLAATAMTLILAGVNNAKLSPKAKMAIQFSVAGIFIITAASWLQIKIWWPSFSLAMSDLASDPYCWFVLFAIVLAWGITNTWRTTRPISPIDAAHIEIMNQTQKELTRDIQTNLKFAVDLITTMLIEELISIAPLCDGLLLLSEEEREQRYAAIEEFVKRVSGAFFYSDRQSAISTILNHAEREAEKSLRKMPLEQRPSDIDPIYLQKYISGELRCGYLKRYLISQKQEKQEEMLAQRSQLIDRLARHV